MKDLLKTSIKNLNQALKRLKEAAKLSSTRIHKDATIQRFEFSFELSWKTIKIFLGDQGIECKSPKDCFRKAADFGLIKKPLDWFGYLEARNLIAHTYNEKIANRIYKKAVVFIKVGEDLLSKLKE